eukprot:GHRR01007587.1.p1 GENE.GHRR01007587.1~~GHRR01007587.1.p1  ORF type:complete len:140 (-),score=28.94 GHRR01007587.1:1009-1428(-)
MPSNLSYCHLPLSTTASDCIMPASVKAASLVLYTPITGIGSLVSTGWGFVCAIQAALKLALYQPKPAVNAPAEQCIVPAISNTTYFQGDASTSYSNCFNNNTSKHKAVALVAEPTLAKTFCTGPCNKGLLLGLRLQVCR